MLNEMKKQLSKIHKTASKAVLKRLVVAIQEMEKDIHFYENNWNLFKNTRLEVVDDISDHETVLQGD